jgi:hypothetical protein
MLRRQRAVRPVEVKSPASETPLEDFRDDGRLLGVGRLRDLIAAKRGGMRCIR